METYMIFRSFFDGDKEVIETDLTLEEAREHCQDPDTSSRTCTDPELVAMTEERGDWFDGYEEE
jgi:hypothetical protein